MYSRPHCLRLSVLRVNAARRGSRHLLLGHVLLPAGNTERVQRGGLHQKTETSAKSEAYCSIFKDLQARGLRSTSFHGRQIYRQVSGKHRVEYTQKGKLPMPAEVMVYLMNNLPFAAELVNAYQGTKFQGSLSG